MGGLYRNVHRRRADAVALGRWRELDVERYPHEPPLERIWQLRANVGAYDAVYLALAADVQAL